MTTSFVLLQAIYRLRHFVVWASDFHFSRAQSGARAHYIHRFSMYRSRIDLSEIDPWKDDKDRSQSF